MLMAEQEHKQLSHWYKNKTAVILMHLKRFIAALAVLAVLMFAVAPETFAGDTYVRGYYRKNGTYVQPHYRSAPDGTVTNNYSYRGNVNPYTGSIGTNSYEHDITSPYFNGTPYSDGHIGHGASSVPIYSTPYSQHQLRQ